MANFDFSAPFVAARIVLPGGDVFPLWTNIGGAETSRPVVPGTENIQALAFVQEVQVELDLSGLPKISIQMSPPFEDGMKFLDSPLADGLRVNRIEVQLGYAGGAGDTGSVLSPPFTATLNAPEVTIDTEIQIAMKGQGLGASTLTQGGRVVGRGNEKIIDIVRRLAQGETGERRTLEVDFSSVEEGSQAWSELYKPANEFAQGGRTDWLALWVLAEQTHCMMMVVGPTERGRASTLRWLPKRGENFSGPPTRMYRLYHFKAGQFTSDAEAANLAKTVAEMPILSFSCNTEAIWNAVNYQDALNHGVKLAGVDPDAVEPSETTVTVESVGDPVDSTEGAQTLEGSDELPDVPVTLPGDPDNSQAVTRAEAEVGAGAGMVVQCQIEVLGDPTVLPGDVVSLGGLGSRFDHRVYHVYTVSHSIGTGGFSTTLMLTSNVDSTVRENAREPTGARNKAEVEAQEEYTAAPAELSDSELADVTGIQF